jgi:hypothetical protein
MAAAGRDQGGGAREGGGCGVQVDAEKEVQGSSLGFIEREREGKAAAEVVVSIDGHGAGGFDSNSSGGACLGETERDLKRRKQSGFY